MPITAAELIARVTVQGAEVAAAQLGATGKAAEAAQARFTQFAAVGAGVVVAGLIAVGVKSADMAAKFNTATLTLVTGAGEQASALDKVRQSILQMAPDVGTSTDELVKGMYMIESSGQHGAKALLTLRDAAEGAKVGGASLAAVANGVTTIMTDYASKHITAAQATNTLIAAVSLGKTHMQDLATAMSTILPTSSAVHVSLNDTAAAMATMTAEGTPASSAATYLKQMLIALEAPAKKGKDALSAIGLTTGQVATDMRKSLPDTLKLITDHLKATYGEGSPKYIAALKDIAGGSRQMQGILELTGSHLTTFKNNVVGIAGAVSKGGSSITGFALVQRDAGFKADQLKASMETLGITLGEKLLPIFSKIADAVRPLISGFTSFISSLTAGSPTLAILGGILAGLAVVILAAVVPAIIAMGAAMLSAEIMGAPLIAIVLAVIAVVAGIILVIQHWGQISAWIGGVMSAVGTKIHEVVSNIGTAFSQLGTKAHEIVTSIGNFFSGMGTKIHDALNAAAVFMITKFNDILNFVKSIPGKIGQVLSTLAGVLLAPFKWFYDHNIYVKAAVDAILLDLTKLRNLVGTIFSAIGTFIHDKLVWIQQTTGAIFSAIGTFIHDRLTWIKNTVGSIFSAIGTFIRDKLTAAKNDVGNIFSAMGSLVSQKVNDLKNAVGNAFSALGSLMHDKVAAAWNGLVSFASGWPSAAFRWGANLVQGLINGLGSLLGAVRDKVGQIAGAIGKFLGFHSPTEEGPGRDSDTWMPNLINMLAGGLSAGQGKMKAALAGLMSPLATSMHVSATGSLSGVSGLSGSVARSIASGGGQTIVVNVQSPDVNLDGWRVTDRLMPHIASKIRWNSAPGMGR